MKSFLLTLAALAVAAPLALGLIAGTSYYTTTEGSIPRPSVTVLGQKLWPAGHIWREPVFGGALYRRFVKEPPDEPENIGEITRPRLELEIPDGYEAEVTLTRGGEQVFRGMAELLAEYAFGDNGEYVALVSCERAEEPGRGYGALHYSFAFDVEIEPQMDLPADWVNPGELLAVRLSQLGASASPRVSTELGEAVLLPAGEGAVVALVPVPSDAQPGNYAVSVGAGGFSWEVQVRVTDVRFPYGTAARTPDAAYAREIEPLYASADAQRYWDGAFEMPAGGDIVMGYGTLMPAGTGENAYHRPHEGIDIRTENGAEIAAPAAGKVLYAGRLANVGSVVVIEHGYGLQSILYCMGEVSVRAGDAVEIGGAIGTAGGAGTPDLHYEVRLGGTAIDPAPLLAGSSPALRYT